MYIEKSREKPLFGFEEIQEILKDLFFTKKLHHSLLLSGSQSIGKASFAKKLALDLLYKDRIDNNSPKFIGTNHPDLLILEKPENSKVIPVDQIRLIGNFVNKTSSISKSKFIIIDSIDELNKSSANAILKILEEPLANNFLILINHNSENTLQTIKSRCFTIKIPNLTFDNFKKIITLNNDSTFEEKELQLLSSLTNNSPENSLAIIKTFNDVSCGVIYTNFLQSVINNSINDFFIKKITSPNFDKENFVEIFGQIVILFLTKLTNFSLGLTKQDFYQQEKEAYKVVGKKINGDLYQLLNLQDEVRSLLVTTKSLNLDSKQSLINIFNIIFYG